MATLDESKKDFFVNPYNFVPTTKKIERSGVIRGELTGKISCKLLVTGELALPDHSAETAKDSCKFDFFRINGSPVVAGSQIRGVIRSVYESITPSCYSVINNNILSSRLARPDPKVLPGILKKSAKGWEIYPAKKYSGKKKNSMPGEPTLTRRWKELDSDRMKTLYFYQESEKSVYKLNEKEINNFKELIDIYIEPYEKEGKITDMTKVLYDMKEKLNNGEAVPVYYKLEGFRLKYFSPSQVSRQVFNNSVRDLLGEHGKECNVENGYCPACRLFGIIDKESSVASRLRFSDGTAVSVTLSDDYKTFPELASPKITSVEFYSMKGKVYDDAFRWNYDDSGVKLNGRKFYYHSTPKTVPGDPNKRSFATRTAQKGSEFVFDVYFENISETELKQLLWVLALGENSADSKLQHKLGAGKPVGYGSVKMTVDKVLLRSHDEGSYEVSVKSYEDYAPDEAMFGEDEAVNALKTITNVNTVKDKTVSYPIADDGRGTPNSKASHQWFTTNRPQQSRNNKSFNTGKKPEVFSHVLPSITAKNPELPAYYAPSIIAKEVSSIQTNKQEQPVKAAPVKREALVKGKVYKGITDKMNNSGKKVFVKLSDGTKGVCDRKQLEATLGVTFDVNSPLNVSVRFDGQDASNNNRNMFTIVKE